MTFFQLHQSLRDPEHHETDRRDRTDPTAPQSALFFHPARADRRAVERPPAERAERETSRPSAARPRLRLVEPKAEPNDDDRRHREAESPPLRLVGAGVA